LHVTLPQELVTVVPHFPSHFGSSQQAPSLHAWPLPQLKVRSPQEFVTLPQKVGLGLAGKSQHFLSLQARPPPHEFAAQKRVPQLFVTLSSQVAPVPPQVGSVQQVPVLSPLGMLHCLPLPQGHGRFPPQLSLTVPHSVPQLVRLAQHSAGSPGVVAWHDSFVPQEQSSTPPQPSGSAVPH
jgi:hypothetical protein